MTQIMAPGTGIDQTDRVIQRVITRSSASSARLKVCHRELAVVWELTAAVGVGSWVVMVATLVSRAGWQIRATGCDQM